MNGPRRVGPHQLAVYDHPAETTSTDTATRTPRVVFVHGSMDRAAAFLKVVRRLPELDRVRYDRRGYGRSATARVADSLAEQVADLLSVVDGERSVLIGHSLGGVIALATAERRPELVAALGVFEAPMGWAPWWPDNSAGRDAMAALSGSGPEDAAEVFMRRMIGDDRWEQLPPSTRAARRAEGPALVGEIRALRDDGAPYVADRVAVPAVVARGSRAAPHHVRASDELASSVSGAELVIIDGAGHGAPTSHPDDFAAFVRRAVARGMIPA